MSPLTLCFALCSVVGFSNVWRLWKDKVVSGVSYIPSAIYAITNAYEIYYFASLGDWWTSAGAVLMCSGTAIWLLLALYYRHVRSSGSDSFT